MILQLLHEQAQHHLENFIHFLNLLGLNWCCLILCSSFVICIISIRIIVIWWHHLSFPFLFSQISSLPFHLLFHYFIWQSVVIAFGYISLWTLILIVFVLLNCLSLSLCGGGSSLRSNDFTINPQSKFLHFIINLILYFFIFINCLLL